MSTVASKSKSPRRASTGCGLMALAAAIVLAAGLIFIATRPPWFSESEGRVTAESIGASFNQIAELGVEEYVYSNVGSFDKDGLMLRGFEIPFTGRNFLVSFDGKVTAGVKHADQINVEIIDRNQLITVSVPQVEVLNSQVNADSVVVHDQSMNPINQVRVEDVTGFVQEQERLATQKAVDQGLLQRAEQRTAELLENHTRALVTGTPLEAYDVLIRWGD